MTYTYRLRLVPIIFPAAIAIVFDAGHREGERLSTGHRSAEHPSFVESSSQGDSSERFAVPEDVVPMPGGIARDVSEAEMEEITQRWQKLSSKERWTLWQQAEQLVRERDRPVPQSLAQTAEGDEVESTQQERSERTLLNERVSEAAALGEDRINSFIQKRREKMKMRPPAKGTGKAKKKIKMPHYPSSFEPDEYRVNSEYFGPFRLDYHKHSLCMEGWNFVVTSPESKHGSGNVIIGKGNFYDHASNSLVAGHHNTAEGADQALLGGTNNVAAGRSNTIVGGLGNVIEGNYSGTYGGQRDSVTGNYGVVFGGTGNVAQGIFSADIGGSKNTASGRSSVVAGGTMNLAKGEYSTLSGGKGNQAFGKLSAVGGGAGKVVTGRGQHIYEPQGLAKVHATMEGEDGGHSSLLEVEALLAHLDELEDAEVLD